jgi:hypothetical protein
MIYKESLIKDGHQFHQYQQKWQLQLSSQITAHKKIKTYRKLVLSFWQAQSCWYKISHFNSTTRLFVVKDRQLNVEIMILQTY